MGLLTLELIAVGLWHGSKASLSLLLACTSPADGTDLPTRQMHGSTLLLAQPPPQGWQAVHILLVVSFFRNQALLRTSLLLPIVPIAATSGQVSPFAATGHAHPALYTPGPWLPILCTA